jgi:hypothetical protein
VTVEYTLRDIASARVSGDHRRLTEASLSRVKSHVDKATGGGGSFAVLTSWRDENEPRVNSEHFQQLRQHVRSSGHGFVKMHGAGQEKDAATGETKVVHEPSMFVPGMNFKQAHALAKKYNQHSFIYSGPETGGKVHLHGMEADAPLEVWDTYHPKLAAKYHSKIKGKRAGQPFHIDSKEFPAEPMESVDPDAVPEPNWDAIWIDYVPNNLSESIVLDAYVRMESRS